MTIAPAAERSSTVRSPLSQRLTRWLHARSEPVSAYALALALSALAAALQWSVQPWVPARGIFVLFPPMMVIAATRGGTGPGLLVLAMGLISGALGAMPTGSLVVANARDQAMLAAFTLTGLALVAYVSRVRRARQRGHQAEERLRLAQEHTGIGLFELDFEHNTAYATPSLCDLVGRPQMNDSMALNDWLRSLPPTNVEETMRVLDTKRREGVFSYEREHSFLLPNGQVRWLLSRVRVDTDAEGKMLRTRGAAIDVSERKRLDMQLQQARAELEQQVQDLRQLHELSTHLLEHAELAPQLQTILAAMTAFHGAARGLLSVFDAATGRLQVHSTVGIDGPARAALASVSTDIGACGISFASGASVTVPNLAQDPRFAPLHQALRPLGVAALHSTPLIGLSSEVLGVVTVYFAEPHETTERERQLADICARKAAVFIERAQARARADAHQLALQEADRRKDEFLATLAHELRNPLAPIRQAALVAGSTATDAQRRWSHEVIERQVQQMAMLLDDLLDVSRITRGTLHLRPRALPLSAVVEAAIETATPSIDAMRHHLTVRLPDEPVTLQADPLRLAQVISNVLINAAKYTPTGGRIALTAQRVDTGAPRVRIDVQDNGIGIRPESLNEIFEMFTQARASDHSGSGLGIGLALAKGLVAMHDGQITAHSEGPGRGTRVTIELPACAPGSMPEADDVDTPAAHAKAGLRVLVADDNRDAADSLAMVLELYGHAVEVAYDGQAAWDAFDRGRHDVAVLDLGMPGLRGEEVAAAIRRACPARHTLLVALTGWGQDGDKRRAREAGFDHHLTKPVDPRQLQELIERGLLRPEVAQPGFQRAS